MTDLCVCSRVYTHKARICRLRGRKNGASWLRQQTPDYEQVSRASNFTCLRLRSCCCRIVRLPQLPSQSRRSLAQTSSACLSYSSSTFGNIRSANNADTKHSELRTYISSSERASPHRSNELGMESRDGSAVPRMGPRQEKCTSVCGLDLCQRTSGDTAGNERHFRQDEKAR